MNILNKLSVSEMIQLLRQKASEFNKKADDLENLLQGLGIGEDGIVFPSTQPTTLRDPGLADIAAVLRRKRAGRPQEIANELGATKRQVLRIIGSNPDAFEMHGKGWIKLRQNGVAHSNGG